MAKGTVSFRVERAPEEVFAYIADLERAPEWVPDLVSVTKTSDGPVGVGTTYDEVVKMGNKTGQGTLRVTHHEPPRLFAHDGQGGPVSFTATFTLEPDGSGTRVRHDYTVDFQGAMRLMAPLIKGWVHKNSEKAAQNLARLLDGGAASA